MSKKQIIQCDICDKSVDAQLVLPPGWLTVTQSSALYATGATISSWAYMGDMPVTKFSAPELVLTGGTLHFCSDACLAIWLQRRGNAIVPKLETQQEQIDYKARRFLLFNESGDSTECVKWENGRITIEPPYDTGQYTFPSWERFKETYPGSGVQWIDREQLNGDAVPSGALAMVGEKEVTG